MKQFYAVAFTALLPLSANALNTRTNYSKESSAWKERPLVILGTEAYKGLSNQQVKLLTPFAADLKERKVPVVLADSETEAQVRKEHKLPAGFQVLLIGKDGGVKLKSSFPIKPTKILTLVDTMPMRIEEMEKANFE